MTKPISKGCRTQGVWQQEVAAIDLQIRELQTVINQLKARRREIIEKHKKRRRCLWDADTPMRKLVPLAFESQFITMMKEWEKHTTHTIRPMKTSHFTFVQERKKHVIWALAMMLMKDKHVFKVSILQLCKYLESHSNLGSQETIRKSILRMKTQISQESQKVGT